MVYNWIDAKAYKMDCFLFFDRWILDFFFKILRIRITLEIWRKPYTTIPM